MKPLPQRKKTAEEIAKLREGFLPPAVSPAAAPVSEIPAPAPVPSAPAEPRPPIEAKPVTSLRKSEQGPSTRKAIAASNPQSAIPAQRRSDFELNEIRRSSAPNVQVPATFLIALTAHPALAGAGYFFVFIAAVLPFLDWKFFDVPFTVPAVLCALGLAIAGYIFLKKKRSLHHAGFIAAIAMFVIIFSALYYFPQLRNAP